ncbi:hypothetical protein E3A20_07660 [Planctomyces bekefii]|uniref:Uncharacterized protein n=1 Tax=Planctomyces bekefii TaxID=1653850 RepID=A0A5C6MBC6_9PLAN|nr:hypothetical protein E3A20_07660 [Planctomyces bekefii]
MITGHESDARATGGEIRDAGHHATAGVRPMPAATQAPAVDKVSQKIQLLRLVSLEAVQNLLGP